MDVSCKVGFDSQLIAKTKKIMTFSQPSKQHTESQPMAGWEF